MWILVGGTAVNSEVKGDVVLSIDASKREHV